MKLLYTFILIMLLFRSHAQTNTVVMEIKGTPVTVLKITECTEVYRMVKDSIISNENCKPDGIPRSLGEFRGSMCVPKFAVQHFHRDFFNSNGVSWTRLTDDQVTADSKFVLEPQSDSITEIRRLPNFWSHDTVTQINPVTLKEDMAIQIDSSPYHSYFHLGEFSKAELKAAVAAKWGIDKYGPYGLKGLYLEYITGDGSYTVLDYSQPDSQQKAMSAIDELPDGTLVLVGYLKLYNKATHHSDEFDGVLCDLRVRK